MKTIVVNLKTLGIGELISASIDGCKYVSVSTLTASSHKKPLSGTIITISEAKRQAAMALWVAAK